jgi:hypothetical protein
MTSAIADTPVRKSITVRANADRAFRVFTEGMDTWWPRTHHIGKTPMLKTILEGRCGGRCYSTHEDGAQVDWGKVLVWEPPRRFVFAWQVNPDWTCQPDLAKSSEVEVTFLPQADGSTRVELEHRYISRHGAGWETMHTTMQGPGAWSGMLDLFAKEAEKTI